MVKDMGARFSPDLNEDVNYLIASKSGSLKYSQAVEQNIPILSPSWVEECHREKKLVPIEGFRLPPFTGLSICVTGLDRDERDNVEQLVKKHGGEYHKNLEFKRTTHLVALEPTGEKYTFAKQWCLDIVTVQWIYDCVSSNVYMPVTPYSLTTSPPPRVEWESSMITETEDSIYGATFRQPLPPLKHVVCEETKMFHVLTKDEKISRHIQSTASVVVCHRRYVCVL